MGLKSEKGKKNEGLALLLGPNDAPEPTPSDIHEELNAALSYMFDVEPTVSFSEGGSISYAAVESLLVQRIALVDIETSKNEGRIGTGPVQIDVASRYGHIGISEFDPFTVESQGNFSSCRATHCYFAGKWMFEAILGTGGIQQIGWATLWCPFTREEGVGDADDSYAFDGKRVKKWSVEPAHYGQPWTPGDVIGCCADFDVGELIFYRNGKSLGTAFRDIRILKPELGYFPAISLSEGERCTLNFGAKPFHYPVDSFKPCETQPSLSEQKLVKYFVRCLCRLVEIKTSNLFPKSNLSNDEMVLLVAVVMQKLRPFLRNVYHVLHTVLPSMMEMRSYQSVSFSASLETMINLYENTLSRTDFESLMQTVLEQAIENCRILPFRAFELPYTAAYNPLHFVLTMLKSPSIKRIFFSCPRRDQFLEGCLTRKQPTEEDMKELLPNVWWKGCKDETMSEELMKSLESTLSNAYCKIEQLHFELFMMLLSEETNDRRLSKSEPTLIPFLLYLLKKNAGAARDVPPPGLSNSTVLVSVFNFLSRLLNPFYVSEKQNLSETIEFPARRLFAEGWLSEDEALHERIPRLGGVFSHLCKENKVEIEPVEVVLEPDFASETNTRFISIELFSKFHHILMLAFRLGIESSFKLSIHQFQEESSQRSSLLKMESKIVDPDVSEKEKKQLVSEIQKQKEQVIKSIRESIWYKIVWFTPSKQRMLFSLTVFLSKLMNTISSQTTHLFLYVPEVYVEAMLEIFQVLSKVEPRFAGLTELDTLGIGHIISFLVKRFTNIQNPQISDSILQALSAVFADKELLKACERNEDAGEDLIRNLVNAFDSRHWLAISNIFLTIAKGTGFGHTSTSGGSPVFRDFFVQVCSKDLSLLDIFLNRLFENLNWTMTELVIILGELADILNRVPTTSNSLMLRQPRKAAVLFNLSINLLRLLEFAASQIPTAFLTGSNLNIARSVEVVGYVLSHMTVGSDSAAFETVVQAPQTGREWKSKMSRTLILAPVAGILVYLHSQGPIIYLADGQKIKADHSIVDALVEDLACPSNCLHFLLNVDWKTSFQHIHKSSWNSKLKDVIHAYIAKKEESTKILKCYHSVDMPDEFLDPITMVPMKNPVMLPDSRVVVDRSTIERHLLTSSTDPYSRSHLAADMLIPQPDLETKIAKWIEEKESSV